MIAKLTAKKMKLLIPAYGDKLLSAAVKMAPICGPKMAVVLNPQSGPGSRYMASIFSAKTELEKHGAEVWFYIDNWAGPNFSPFIDARNRLLEATSPRVKLAAEMVRERQLYEMLYGRPLGYFIDDTTTHEDAVNKTLVFAGTKRIWNPGNPDDAHWFDFPGDAVVIWEDAKLLDRKDGLKGNPLHDARPGVMALNESHWADAMAKARAVGATYFFASDVAGDPYSRPPRYLEAMMKALP